MHVHASQAAGGRPSFVEQTSRPFCARIPPLSMILTRRFPFGPMSSPRLSVSCSVQSLTLSLSPLRSLAPLSPTRVRNYTSLSIFLSIAFVLCLPLFPVYHSSLPFDPSSHPGRASSSFHPRVHPLGPAFGGKIRGGGGRKEGQRGREERFALQPSSALDGVFPSLNFFSAHC